jgi:uncharacterized protein YacL
MLFHLLKIDLDFITTFLFTIFTIAISIFFYNESTKTANIIRSLVIEVKGKVEHLGTNEKTEDLSILHTSSNRENIRRFYKKDG